MRRAVVVFASSALACNALLAIDDLPSPLDAGADASGSSRDAVADDAARAASDASDASAASDVAAASDASDASAPGADADTGARCVPSMPDGGCNVGSQCGCAPNETCDVLNGGGTVGCVSAGIVGEGLTCFAGDCAVGLTCYLGICHRFCEVVDAGCSTSTAAHCERIGYATNGPVNVCHYDCDLADAAHCASGESSLGCVYDFGVGVTDCAQVNAATTRCLRGVCAPGYVCLDDLEAGTCARWCHPGAPNACPQGKACIAGGNYPVVVANGVTYGECM